MRDFKYEELYLFASGIAQREIAVNRMDSLQNKVPLGPATASFNTNVARIETLVRLPIFLMDIASLQQLVSDTATFRLTQTLEPTPAQMPSMDAFAAERVRLMKIALSGGAVSVRSTPWVDADSIPIHFASCGNLQELLTNSENNVPGLIVAIESLLASVLISAWTAFETLAGDLWVAAVNARPDSLGENVFGTNATIDFGLLREFDYQIEGRLGDAARKKDHGKFNSLDSIKEAYLLAFRAPPGDAKAKSSPNLVQLFNTYFRPLRVLELLRNLLAHQGGKVDAIFLAKIKPFDYDLAKLEADKPIPLQGNMVIQGVGPVIEFGTKLIEFVDSWMKQIKS